ncbi:hypothetical protein FRC07_005628, partial [Ceratobasidium sp. 392]
MISPWMENGTLRDYVLKHLGVDRWATCIQVTEGLHYIHDLGMIHGDLKAMNILVSGEGVIKITDFGNSVLENCSLAFSASGVAGGGTARWMAPELISREDAAAADRSMPADVYALGMTILEVMTGKHPYDEIRPEPAVTLAIIKGRRPRRPVTFSSEQSLGDKRWSMLLGCWKMEPDQRPTAIEVKRTERIVCKGIS